MTPRQQHWELDEDGLMQGRDMSAKDHPIEQSERRYRC
jgi:nuclear transport factor 2 (NTF2) superfamily protein